jgi:HD-like signal output (HDOD) protein
MASDAKEIKETLFAQIGQNSDFPVMSQTITLLNNLKSSDDSSSTTLSNIILKDYALTMKILKLVNSVGYLQFGEVTTISRAIMLLGFENIRNIALSLLLFDQLGGMSAGKVKELLLRAVCSGVLAQKMADEMKFVNVEEAFICSLFHTFGTIMTAFYMPEKIEEITKLCAEKGHTEEVAAMSVLGASFEAIGKEIAETWNFPKKIVLTMKKIRPSEIKADSGELEKLCSLSNFSNEMTGLIASPSPAKDKEEQFRKLMNIYKAHFGDIENVKQLISDVASDMAGYADTFGLNDYGLLFFRNLTQWDTGAKEEAAPEKPPGEIPTGLSSIEGILDAETEKTPDTVFSKGVLEINTAILNDYPLNEVIKIALETIYRGLNFSGTSKVLFFLRDSKTLAMKIKFGFGGDLSVLRQWFEFSLDKPEDIFNLAMAKPTDLVIRDITTPDITPLLPPWFSKKISDTIFIIILPIVINKKPIGLVYIEGDRMAFGKVTAGELKYLTMLRDQTVLAIKQKHTL